MVAMASEGELGVKRDIWGALYLVFRWGCRIQYAMGGSIQSRRNGIYLELGNHPFTLLTAHRVIRPQESQDDESCDQWRSATWRHRIGSYGADLSIEVPSLTMTGHYTRDACN